MCTPNTDRFKLVIKSKCDDFYETFYSFRFNKDTTFRENTLPQVVETSLESNQTCRLCV